MAHKLSWSLFVLIGTLGTLMSTRALFEPASLLTTLAAAGPSAAALESPEAAAFVAFLGRWTATAMIGGNVFTVVIALTALRRRERWAAWLMLYWPLMFASHYFLYEPGPMRVVQIVWLCLSVPALLVLLRSSSAAPSRATRPSEVALA